MSISAVIYCKFLREMCHHFLDLHVTILLFVHLHRCNLHFIDILHYIVYLLEQQNVFFIVGATCIVSQNFAIATAFITIVHAECHLYFIYCV